MKQQKYIYLEHRKTKGQRLASLVGMKQKKKLHNFTAILTRFFAMHNDAFFVFLSRNELD